MSRAGETILPSAPRLISAGAGPRSAPVRPAAVQIAGDAPRAVASDESRTSKLGFAALLGTIGVLFIRPAEFVPELLGLPLYEGLILAAAVPVAQQLLRPFRWNALQAQPINLCVVGVWALAVISHLTHADGLGAFHAAAEAAKVLVFYALTLTLIDTPRRLRTLMFVTAVSSVAMISLCVVDYAGIYDFGFIQHLQQRHGVDLTGEVARIARMRGTGIFQDPNDLCMLIVACGVMCTYFLTTTRRSPARVAWVVLIAICALGVWWTRSRGGLLAGGLAGLVLIDARYGRKWAVTAGVCGVLLLSAAAGRQADIDLSEDTGHERLLLWRDGMEVLKTPEALFGIGMNRYEEIAPLVAHNSFVHAYVELGLIGGTFFLGCYFFSALGLTRLAQPGTVLRQDTLRDMRPFLLAILAGWCAGMLSLSRNYITPTYLLIGMASIHLTLAQRWVAPQRTLIQWDAPHVRKLAITSLICVIVLMIVVKAFT